MTENEKLNLKLELEKLNNIINNLSELVDPKIFRRRDRLMKKIYGNWSVSKGFESKRVTSFTRDRR